MVAATPRLEAASPYEVNDHTRNAFSNPFPSLSREERRDFFVGNSFFRLGWTQAPASTADRDGLGPTFNAVSCSSCHLLDGRGPGVGMGFTHISLLFRLDDTPAYGNQLNPFSIDGVPGEGQSKVTMLSERGTFPDGETYELMIPVYSVENWMFGTPPAHARLSARVGAQLIGLGLLEKIPASEIESREDAEDKNGDGISGRASRVLNLRTGKIDLGRFGWKAEQPTLEQQNAAAFNGDLGLTSALFPEENCPTPQTECRNSPNGGSPEVSDEILERVTFYTRHIALPTRRDALYEDVRHGEYMFQKIGCANCHTPQYTVDGVAIFPHTDMLLHDMGEGLADRDLAGNRLATEWRTPPLWGIGLIKTVNRHDHLLHDGRARGVQEAILWHGGEGTAARESYKNLSKTDRAAIVRYVESL